uniref:Thioredoxin domain-containing protein n=1 Tax=Globodera pallida TaxID=36090 RepID=A0A183C1J7_GLOPA
MDSAQKLLRYSTTSTSFVCFLFVSLFCLVVVDSEVLQLDKDNIENALKGRDLVLVNFYADWCRFSQNLKPIYLEASEKLKENPKVLFAMVDSEALPELAQKFHVNKYPTIKLFRFGELIKKEYRGQRSVDAISEHVHRQLESPVQTFNSTDDLTGRMDGSKRNVFAYFIASDDSQPAIQHFHRSASSLRDDCSFWIGSGDWVRSVVGNESGIFFRDPHAEDDFHYSGPLDNFDYMKKWLTDKCVPLVREITFENAEELTEEGIPFLILFRIPGDLQAERLFTDVVTTELEDQKNTINFLVADGKKFAHPLHHLGKSERDLPLIAIDSFRHMEKGRLRQFVLDLHAGKLHREFHQGPDPTQPPSDNPSKLVNTQPPSSVFKQLKPSETRYSLLDKTEL